MKNKHWEITENIDSRRKTMLRYVWIVIAAMLITSYLLPLIGGVLLHLSPLGYSLVVVYLVFCFILSLKPKTYKLTPHLMMIGMTFLFTYLCTKKAGINSPISHFLPLIPALASQLLRPKYCLFYGLLALAGIVISTLFAIDTGINDASAYDIQNAATLILATLIVTGGSYFSSVYERKLARGMKEKLGLDPLTKLPNQYSLIQQYEELMSGSFKHNESLMMINFGIDQFTELHNIHGQQMTDSVLTSVASNLSSITNKKKDLIITRNQGNSFILVFLDKSEDYAQSLATTALNLFEMLKTPNLSGEPISISASIMMIEKNEHSPGAYDALARSQYHLSMIQSVEKRTIEVVRQH